MSDTKVKEATGVQVTAEVMLPVELEGLLHKAFQMQIEYQNESKFVPVFMRDSLIAYTKYYANAAINDWERSIAKCQKLHKEFNREQAISFLRETRSGKELEELATVAEVVKQELS